MITKGEWGVMKALGMHGDSVFAGNKLITRCDSPDVCIKENQANARLIAAAPALLAACEELGDTINHLIALTPTGATRESLTDKNIRRLAAIKAAKE